MTSDEPCGMVNVGAISCGRPENRSIDWAPTRGAPTGYEKKDELLSNSEKSASSVDEKYPAPHGPLITRR